MNIQNIQTTSPAGAGEINRSQAADRAQAGAENTSSAATGSSTAAAGHADQASLSRASQLMAQVSGLPDADTEKVTAVQNALAAGTYQVSSADVAAKMIASLTR